MLEALLILPVAAALASLGTTDSVLRRRMLIVLGLAHAACAAGVTRDLLGGASPRAFAGLMAPDMLGALFLTLASLIFCAAAFYAVGYLREETRLERRRDLQDGRAFTNAPERRFASCLCLFLAAMTIVTTTPHLGLLWVGIELTTLTSAPLIYFHRHRRSMEATWKYLMICSVGIALALIGNILLGAAFHGVGGNGVDQLHDFVGLAARGVPAERLPWLKAAFIFFLVGYGTKTGLAPLHNWLPDAHSEAPSMVSALLSGALLNCAFLGILRGYQILAAAGLGGFGGDLLVLLGMLSLALAMAFIVGQGHYKRLLAYSSVEHMGILALGVGIGGLAAGGAMLHAVCHSLAKCALFLLAGNILTRYRTLSSYDVRGLRRTMPMTAFLWTAGFLAIVGTPPFGLFVSELSVARGILDSPHPWLLAPYLGCLGVIFVGMSVPVLRMLQGPCPADLREAGADDHESVHRTLPSFLFLAIVLVLGLWTPGWLIDCLNAAVRPLGVTHAF